MNQNLEICPHCRKPILKDNFEIHEAQCGRRNGIKTQEERKTSDKNQINTNFNFTMNNQLYMPPVPQQEVFPIYNNHFQRNINDTNYLAHQIQPNIPSRPLQNANNNLLRPSQCTNNNSVKLPQNVDNNQEYFDLNEEDNIHYVECEHCSEIIPICELSEHLEHHENQRNINTRQITNHNTIPRIQSNSFQLVRNTQNNFCEVCHQHYSKNSNLHVCFEEASTIPCEYCYNQIPHSEYQSHIASSHNSANNVQPSRPRTNYQQPLPRAYNGQQPPSSTYNNYQRPQRSSSNRQPQNMRPNSNFEPLLREMPILESVQEIFSALINQDNRGRNSNSAKQNLKGLKPAEISEINSMKINESQLGKYEPCTICQCDFEKNDKVLILGCLHVYHEKCLTQWISKNPLCPICKFNQRTQLTQ